MKNALYCMGLVWLAWMPNVSATVPRMTGATKNPVCVDAMRLANGVFRSSAVRLYAPDALPSGMASRMILGTFMSDVSGGDALRKGMTNDFERVAIPGGSLYWLRQVKGHARHIVITSESVGWRGDLYSLFLVDASIDKKYLLDNWRAHGRDASKAVIANTWRPPWVFRLPDGTAWFVSLPRPWRVYAGMSKPICTIRFTEAPGDPVRHLPQAVRWLVADLDEALGHPSHAQGTLHSVARTRQHARRVLFNVALRPWALAEHSAVYNSREEVDAGLAKWAKIAPSYARIFVDIRKIYPQAEEALASYYADRFHLTSAHARKEARWVLDLMYRSWFVFHSDEGMFHHDDVNTNPWPGIAPE